MWLGPRFSRWQSVGGVDLEGALDALLQLVDVVGAVGAAAASTGIGTHHGASNTLQQHALSNSAASLQQQIAQAITAALQPMLAQVITMQQEIAAMRVNPSIISPSIINNNL